MHLIPERGAIIGDRAGAASVVVTAGLRAVDMTLGDSPQRFSLDAVFPSGESAVMRPISVTVQDERVARMSGDSIVAVGLGRTEMEMELVTDGARCARSSRIEDTVNCVVYKSGAVIVRNVAFNDAGPARRAFVRIERMP